MSNQLIKETSQGFEKIFPKNYIQNLKDKDSGRVLSEILKSFNMLFLNYTDNKSNTRKQVPISLRHGGLWITYIIDKTIVTEWYNGTAIDDYSWGSDVNWREGSNMLVGDISISKQGTWVINGEDSGITIKGDKGDSPVIRIYDNKIQVSYDKGVTYEDLNNIPVYTKFRFNSQTNTYQVSYDLGANWQDISDEKVYHKFRYNQATNTYQESTDFGKTWSNISAEKVYYQFRTENNRLWVSTDLGTTWENCSEPIAAWFRWADVSGTGNIGKVQISRDQQNWSDLSPTMTNNLYIKGYVATVGDLPSNAAIGDIYMVGPTYDESDTTHDYPHYRMWVKQSSGWVDNGEFTNAGPVSTANIIDEAVTLNKLSTDVQAEIIYDVSAHNNGTVFESLQTILNSSNLNTLIPTSIRKGGMTIRFIQGSKQNYNNKYVSYILTKPTWSININYWTLVTNNEEVVSNEEKEIIILDDEDKEVAKINDNGANFKNLKSNGKTVVTSDELENYTTADEFQEKTENITKDIIESDDEAIILATDKGKEVANIHAEIINEIEECQSWNSDDYDDNGNGEQYAKVTPKGIYAKKFFEMDGTPINTTKINNLYAYSTSGTDDDTHFYGINAIKKALDSIIDNSYNNRYVINVRGRFIFTDITNHTKNINEKNSINTWWVNVYGKDYVTLDGGNKNNTSIEMYLSLDTVFPTWNDGIHNYYGGNYHVLFNNAIWFECKNITFIGHNTRYCVHQESFNETQPSHALYENCVFKFKYDGIWTAQNTNLPNGSNILNGNTVLGCGYRIGGDINYINCDFVSYSLPQYNTLLCGSHTGYRKDSIQEYIPAKIVHKSCSFDGFNVRLVGYSSTSWQTNDELYFEDCKINDLSQVQFGVTAINVYDNAKSTPRVFINHEPMQVINVSTGSQVIKVVAKNGSKSEIRLQSCSAYSIFGENTNDVKPKINEWGAYEYNGTIYKDDTNGLDGYLLGTQALAKKTLGVILGDCSTTNKTLIISLNGVNTSYTFNADYTSTSNSDIITILNAAFADLEFSIVGLSDYEYPTFNNVDLFINNGSVSAKRGMAVVVTPNGFHVATSSERLDGICIDDTPIGQIGRIAKSGIFGRNYIATNDVSFKTGSYYSVGSDAGIFVVNNEKKDNCLIALSYNVCQIKK